MVDVSLLLLEVRHEATHFLGITVPDLDLVASSPATHLHWSVIHSQATYHPGELVISVV